MIPKHSNELFNNEIKKDINDYRKNKWSEHLDTCAQGSKKLWSTIKSLGSNPQQPSNQSISFQNQPTNDPRKMANKFNKQYTPSGCPGQATACYNFMRCLCTVQSSILSKTFKG